MTYEALETHLTEWARTQHDVRAVLVVGSRARQDADQWSDLDVLVLTTNRAHYAADASWLSDFGDLILAYSEPTARGDSEWYAVYDGGLKLDVVLLNVDAAALELNELLGLYPYRGVFARGVRILYDRLGAPRALPPEPLPPLRPPSSAEFQNTVSGLMMATLTTSKFIARGDLFRAQRWFANDLHPHLLRLAEWHAFGRDTWYSGRFIERWADPRFLAALKHLYPTYDAHSLRDSLLAVIETGRWLASETAAQMGFADPAAMHDKVAQLVTTVLDDSHASLRLLAD